jgi:hypothetical protein
MDADIPIKTEEWPRKPMDQVVAPFTELQQAQIKLWQEAIAVLGAAVVGGNEAYTDTELGTRAIWALWDAGFVISKKNG